MERRRFQRVPLSSNVMLVLDKGEPPLLRRGMVSGISFGGVGLYLVQPVESGTKVNVENRFLTVGGQFKTEAVRGTTIYSKYLRDIYLVGIEFDQELNPRDQPDIYSRIREVLKSF
jgi:hypothetical protein